MILKSNSIAMMTTNEYVMTTMFELISRWSERLIEKRHDASIAMMFEVVSAPCNEYRMTYQT